MCKIPITPGVCFNLKKNLDVIGIVHNFSISQKLRQIFLFQLFCIYNIDIWNFAVRVCLFFDPLLMKTIITQFRFFFALTHSFLHLTEYFFHFLCQLNLFPYTAKTDIFIVWGRRKMERVRDKDKRMIQGWGLK